MFGDWVMSSKHGHITSKCSSSKLSHGLAAFFLPHRAQGLLRATKGLVFQYQSLPSHVCSCCRPGSKSIAASRPYCSPITLCPALVVANHRSCVVADVLLLRRFLLCGSESRKSLLLFVFLMSNSSELILISAHTGQ